ncbi:MAG TPA: sigma-54 dependent transcriptional regulator [Gemmatimonadales bacterium]
MPASILCVDDEPAAGAILEHILTRAGHRTVLVSTADEALLVVGRLPVDLILAEYRTSGFAGFDLLARLREEGHRIPVILMTDDSRPEHVAQSMESGAIDYLTKPIRAESLEIAVRRALELVRLRRENVVLRRELARVRSRDELVGDSEPFRRTMSLVAAVAVSRAPVLLQGEPGAGKELLARAIHDQGPWAEAPFVIVSCAALLDQLMDSAAVGPEASGAFNQAHGGTLVLDEIAELGAGPQARLLALLQGIGDPESGQVDVRVIATSSRDLRAEVEAGRFHNDLYDRLNILPIRVPTLRERIEDVPRLALHFARRAARMEGRPVPTFAPETLDLLQRYAWSGNVRELANAVERAVLLCSGNLLQPADFDRPIQEAAMQAYNLDAIERLAIERALAATGGNRTRAARLLGISERTLRNKLNAPRTATEG